MKTSCAQTFNKEIFKGIIRRHNEASNNLNFFIKQLEEIKTAYKNNEIQKKFKNSLIESLKPMRDKEINALYDSVNDLKYELEQSYRRNEISKKYMLELCETLDRDTDITEFLSLMVN